MKPSDIIRDRGWCQGYFQDKEGRVCLYEAVSLAAHEYGSVNLLQAGDKLRDLIGNAMVVWNDVPGRTEEEVLTLLEGAGL